MLLLFSFIRVYPGYHVHGGVGTACRYDGHTGGGFDTTVNSLHVLFLSTAVDKTDKKLLQSSQVTRERYF